MRSPGGFYTDPEALYVHLLGVRVSYFVLLAHVGLVVASAIALLRAKGLPRRPLVAVILSAYVGAILGARMFSVLFDGALHAYLRHPAEIPKFWRGGLVLYGGLLGGTVFGGGSAWLLRLSVARCADTVAPGVAIGLAIGRIGCFVSACCFGTPTTSRLGIAYRNFALPVRPIGVPLHPAPLYESAGLLVIGTWLLLGDRRGQRPAGDRSLTFVALYAILRFLIVGLAKPARLGRGNVARGSHL